MRNNIITLRISDIEKLALKQEFQRSKLKNFSNFIRNRMIWSKIIFYDKTAFENIRRNLSGACNNLNQIAKYCNSNHNISAENFKQISDVKLQLNDIFSEILNLEKSLNQDLWQLPK